MTYMSDIAIPAKQITHGGFKYKIELTRDEQDIRAAQRFRGRLFRNGDVDCDEHDGIALHGIIRDQGDKIVCVFRAIQVQGDEIDGCYSARFYELQSIKTKGLKALELGRFCVHPDHHDPDIIRLAWSELARFVVNEKIDLLFGCSSFEGSNADHHIEALTLLKARHLAPSSFMPKVKAPKIFPFAKRLEARKVDLKSALQAMPPLLRSYLSLGGWVSDHVVVDEDLNTVHVFTGVEVGKIPQRRRETLLSLV